MVHGSLHGVLIDGGKNVCAGDSFYDVCNDASAGSKSNSNLTDCALGHGIDKGVEEGCVFGINNGDAVKQKSQKSS